MSDLSVTNTFVATTTAVASQVNQNFTDIVNYINNRDDGTATWDNVNVTATVGNPVTIKSNQSTTEVAIDNTATDGDPLLSLKLSGSTVYSFGVDDSDSDVFKFGTTSFLTNIAFQIPTTGSQVQIAAGTVGVPGLSFVGFGTSGFYAGSGPVVNCSISGSIALAIAGSSTQFPGGSTGNPGITFITDTDTGVGQASGNQLFLSTGGTQRLFMDANGNVVQNTGANGTSATDGFPYFVSCPGTPTGVPTSYTGRVPMIYDTTNNKFYIYNGGWKGVTLS